MQVLPYDGRFVIVGTNRFQCSYEVRAFEQDGTPDGSFGDGGVARASSLAACGSPYRGQNENFAVDLAVQNGAIVVAGTFGDWQVPDRRGLFIGSFSSEFRVHAIELIPYGAGGQKLR